TRLEGSCRAGSFAACARSYQSAYESMTFPGGSPAAASSYEESLQETSAQETSADVRPSAQLTSLQETSAHETAASEEAPQETSLHETASQETFAFTVDSQLLELKTGRLPPVGSAVKN